MLGKKLFYMIWFFCILLFIVYSSTVNRTLQKGCLEALHLLCQHYPPPSMPGVWGCLEKPYSILSVLLQLLTSSRVVWGIQGCDEVLLWLWRCRMPNCWQLFQPSWASVVLHPLVWLHTYTLSHKGRAWFQDSISMLRTVKVQILAISCPVQMRRNLRGTITYLHVHA